jgi:prolyl 4-hydroxylase
LEVKLTKNSTPSDESHSVIHGRPFPLKGRFYASIFVHFEPFGYTKDLMSKDPAAYLDEEELDEVDNIYEESKQAMIVEANEAAQVGNLDLLQKLVEEDPEIVHKADSNGWRPIHEAARSGNTEILKFLVENGSLVDERTNMDTGGSALFLARESLEEGHPSISYLQSIGAKAVHPIESEL